MTLAGRRPTWVRGSVVEAAVLPSFGSRCTTRSCQSGPAFSPVAICGQMRSTLWSATVRRRRFTQGVRRRLQRAARGRGLRDWRPGRNRDRRGICSGVGSGRLPREVRGVALKPNQSSALSELDWLPLGRLRRSRLMEDPLKYVTGCYETRQTVCGASVTIHTRTELMSVGQFAPPGGRSGVSDADSSPRTAGSGG